MSIGTAIELLIDLWHSAVDDETINKPISWSLYQVWKVADRKEKPRKTIKEAADEQN